MACVAFLVLTLTLLLFISKNNYPDFTFNFIAQEHSKISAAEASPCLSNSTVAYAATPSLRESDASSLRGVVNVFVDDHHAVDHDAKSFVRSLDDDDDEHGVVGKLFIFAFRDATARATLRASERDSRITDVEVEAWRWIGEEKVIVNIHWIKGVMWKKFLASFSCVVSIPSIKCPLSLNYE
jgi:hypothetical protein